MDSIGIPPRILGGDFAGWLRDAMKARSMSARMVGLRTGINHSTITRLLGGERQPTLTTAVALLRLLGSEAENHLPTGLLVADGAPDEPCPETPNGDGLERKVRRTWVSTRTAMPRKAGRQKINLRKDPLP
jgi:transcriptional regulator with XRE-family HTH domain